MRQSVLVGTDEQKQKLSLLYGHNPLKVEIVANTIINLFDGQLGQFLKQNTLLVSNYISPLLEQQLHHLSEIEKNIMYWLAINRELTTIASLTKSILPTISRSNLLKAMENLIQCSLIEKKLGRYTQPPLVMEFITEQFVQQIIMELLNQGFSLLNSHRLITKTAKHQVIKSQIEFILQPIANQLRYHFISQYNLEQHIRYIWQERQNLGNVLYGYGSTNLIYLCQYLEIKLTATEELNNATFW